MHSRGVGGKGGDRFESNNEAAVPSRRNNKDSILSRSRKSIGSPPIHRALLPSPVPDNSSPPPWPTPDCGHASQSHSDRVLPLPPARDAVGAFRLPSDSWDSPQPEGKQSGKAGRGQTVTRTTPFSSIKLPRRILESGLVSCFLQWRFTILFFNKHLYEHD